MTRAEVDELVRTRQAASTHVSASVFVAGCLSQAASFHCFGKS